jgi:type VII secretion protein EccE
VPITSLVDRVGRSGRADRACTVNDFTLRVPIAVDVPAGADPNLDGNTPVGVRADGDTLLTAVAVEPGTPVVRHHTTTESAALLGRDAHLDLALLAQFRASCRVPVTLDLVVVEHRYCGAGTVAAAYRETLGPLPLAASRRVAVVARLSATEIAPTGPHATATALRTAATLTRRLAALLGARGMHATPLSAADLREHTEHLLGPHLAPLSSNGETIVQTTPTEAVAGIATWRTFAVTADATPAALRGLSTDHAVSTTTVLRLSGPLDAPVLHGLVGTTEVPGAGRILRSTPSCLDPLDGRQGLALMHRIPVPHLPRMRLPRLATDAAALRRWRFRLGDDGPLIGADPRGRAVTVPLFSSPAHSCGLTGDSAVVALLVLRCIGAGASIGVHSPDPRRWAPLCRLVDDPGVLALHPDHGGGSTGLAVVDVVDETCADDSVLRVRLQRRSRARTWAHVEASAGDGSRIDVSVGGAPITLTGVAGPAELALIDALEGIA